jgi:drug/metabolite transporter (DMT)-like permease|tara:strand:+ start:107886 stop:108803 length:918 start_codon:yes stop_codon:yes gene_type:complete
LTELTKIHLALVSSVVLWGGMFVAYAYLLPTVPATEIITIRFILVSISFVIVFIFVKKARPKIPKQKIGRLVLLAAIGIPGSQLPAIHSQNYLSPSLASVLVTTSPAWAAVLSGWILREKLRSTQITGFIIAFVGAAIVIIFGSGSGALSVDNPWGAALCLIAPFTWAIFNVLYKREFGDLDPFSTIGVCLIVGSFVMIPFYKTAFENLDNFSGSQWGWMFYTAIGGTVLAYYLWYWALQRLEANKTMSYNYAVPISALLWSWIVMGIFPSSISVLGGIILVGGVYLTQTQALFRRRESVPNEVN